MEFPQIATNGNAITDVVAEARTHVYTGFIVIGACRTVGNGISQPEVGMACTQRNVGIPGSFRAGEVVGAVNPDFVKIGFARHILAVGIGP